jgi:hypothetical protein
MISPNTSYYPPSPFPRLDAPSSSGEQKTDQKKPSSPFSKPSGDSLSTAKPVGKSQLSNQPDAETRIIAGWNQGIKDNKTHKDMTALMGIGCLLMNYVPGLRMRWGTAIKMAIANMGLMMLIHQGMGIIKGYKEKKSL